MTSQPCPLDTDEIVYPEGFTNAQWHQRVNLSIPAYDDKPEQCYTWTGKGENAKPMTGGPYSFHTPTDEEAAKKRIQAQFQYSTDNKNWKDSKVNHAGPPIRIGNYTQHTYITEDGGGADQNDTCMFFRYWRGPLSETAINPIIMPANKTMYVRAFTNSSIHPQRIRITIPGQDPLVYDGHQEGMQEMSGPAGFNTGDITDDKQPVIEFFYIDKDQKEQKSYLSATREDTLNTLHQYTWLARDEKETEHQTVVLCIYHWDKT